MNLMQETRLHSGVQMEKFWTMLVITIMLKVRPRALKLIILTGKQWSGLFSDYYIPRWQLFFKSLEESLVTGRKFHEEKFRKKFLDKIGKPFCEDRSSYSVTPTGDTVGIATKLHRKWSRILGIQM